MQLIRTRMASRHAMQRLLRNSNAGITFEMLQIMSCLWSEQGVTQQTLAERTAKDKACLTNLINNLEKKGWVERREDPSDRRNKQIHLTEAGEELSHRVKPLLHNIYDEVGARLTTRQIESFMNNLKKLDEILDKI